MSGALDGVRVLEVVDETAEYCGRLLAGLGADVVKVEPRQGAPSRRIGPFKDDVADPDNSLLFWHHNVGKRSVVVDTDDELRELIRSAQVLVHTLRGPEAAQRGLLPAELDAGLVICAITPFGQDGPWAGYQADDLVLMALGGSMAACGYGPKDPPLACHGDQAWHTASTYAAIAILAALWHGAGQFIDVSAHQASASMTEWHMMTYLCTGTPVPRFAHPTLEASDGRQVSALTPDFLGAHVFANLLGLLEKDGVAGPLVDPAFADPGHRASHYGEVYRALRRLAERHDSEELWRIGQEAGLPWGVIRSPEEVLEDRHLRARGHFVDIDGVTHCGAPFLAHGSPFEFRRPAPRLGEHTREVMAELAR